MKTCLRKMSLFALLFISSFALRAQTNLVADQNPNFAASRDKYMKLADSLTDWHSTTLQETYKAVDWLADKAEARSERREFRRQLRMERARWNNSYVGDYYYPYYRNRQGAYPGYYHNYNGFGRRNNFYTNPLGLGYWWR